MSVLEISPDAERAWLVLHSDVGPVLTAVYYRPPDDGLDGLLLLANEFDSFANQFVGCFLFGDFNVHHVS